MLNYKENINKGLEALNLHQELKKAYSEKEFEESVINVYAKSYISASKLTFIKREIEIFIEDNINKEFGFIFPKVIDLDNIVSFEIFKREYGERININEEYIMLLPYDDCSTIDISTRAKEKAKDIAWIALDCEYTNNNLTILSIHNHLSELLIEHNQSKSRDNLRVLLYDTPTSYCYNKWSFSTAINLISDNTCSELVDLSYICDCTYSSLENCKDEYKIATKGMNKTNNVMCLECDYSYHVKDWKRKSNEYKSYLSCFKYDNDYKKFRLSTIVREESFALSLITNFFRLLNKLNYAEFERVYKIKVELEEKAHYSHKEIRNIVRQAIETKHNNASYEIYSSALKDKSRVARCYIDVNYRLI